MTFPMTLLLAIALIFPCCTARGPFERYLDIYPDWVDQAYGHHPEVIGSKAWDALRPMLKVKTYGLWEASERILKLKDEPAADVEPVNLALNIMASLPGAQIPDIPLDQGNMKYIKEQLSFWKEHNTKYSSGADLIKAASLPNASEETLKLFIEKFGQFTPDKVFALGSRFLASTPEPNAFILASVARNSKFQQDGWIQEILDKNPNSNLVWDFLPLISNFVNVCRICDGVAELWQVHACLKSCPLSNRAFEWRLRILTHSGKTLKDNWYYDPREDAARLLKDFTDDKAKATREKLYKAKFIPEISPLFISSHLVDPGRSLQETYERVNTWIGELSDSESYWKSVFVMVYGHLAALTAGNEAESIIHIPRLLAMDYLSSGKFVAHHTLYPLRINKILTGIYEIVKEFPDKIDNFYKSFESNALKVKWLLEVLRNPASSGETKVKAWENLVHPDLGGFIPGEYSEYTLNGPDKDCQLASTIDSPAFEKVYRAVSGNLFWSPIISNLIACWIATKAKEENDKERSSLDHWNERTEVHLLYELKLIGDDKLLKFIEKMRNFEKPQLSKPTNEINDGIPREIERIPETLTFDSLDQPEELKFLPLKDVWPESLKGVKETSWSYYSRILNHIDAYKGGWGIPQMISNLEEHVKDFLKEDQRKKLWNLAFKRTREVDELDVFLEKLPVKYFDSVTALPWSSMGWTRLATMVNTWRKNPAERRRMCEIISEHLKKNARVENQSQGLAFLLLDCFSSTSAYNAKLISLTKIYAPLISKLGNELSPENYTLTRWLLKRLQQRNLINTPEGEEIRKLLGKGITFQEPVHEITDFEAAVRYLSAFSTDRTIMLGEWINAWNLAANEIFSFAQRKSLRVILFQEMKVEEWARFLEQHKDSLEELWWPLKRIIEYDELASSRESLCKSLAFKKSELDDEGKDVSKCIDEEDPFIKTKFKFLLSLAEYQVCHSSLLESIEQVNSVCSKLGKKDSVLKILYEWFNSESTAKNRAPVSMAIIVKVNTLTAEQKKAFMEEALKDPESFKNQLFVNKLMMSFRATPEKDGIKDPDFILSSILTNRPDLVPAEYEKDLNSDYFKVAHRLLILVGQERFMRVLGLLTNFSATEGSLPEQEVRLETIMRFLKFVITEEESSKKLEEGTMEKVVQFEAPQERKPVCGVSKSLEELRAHDAATIATMGIDCFPTEHSNNLPKNFVEIPKIMSTLKGPPLVKFVENRLKEEERPVIELAELGSLLAPLIIGDEDGACEALKSLKLVKEFRFTGQIYEFTPSCIARSGPNWIWALIPNQDGKIHKNASEIADRLGFDNFKGINQKALLDVELSKDFWERAPTGQNSKYSLEYDPESNLEYNPEYNHPCATIPPNIEPNFWEGASVQCLTTIRSDGKPLISKATVDRLEKVSDAKWALIGKHMLSIPAANIAALSSSRWDRMIPVIYKYRESHPEEFGRFKGQVLECERERFRKAFAAEEQKLNRLAEEQNMNRLAEEQNMNRLAEEQNMNRLAEE